MSNAIEKILNDQRHRLNHHLNELVENQAQLNQDLRQMMLYSLDAGGKRIRPLLLINILVAEQFEITEDILTVAAAIEAVHTYSLIHDDLPAMDNDDLRRGKLTSHKKFGEAQAILTGDALLTLAFDWIASTDFTSDIKVKLIQDLATASGAQGMIAGQLLDIQGNDRDYTLAELSKLHQLKTGKMLTLPMKMAFDIMGSKGIGRSALMSFTEHFGLAFQIHDDVIDITQSTAELGKTAQKDNKLHKNTYVNLLGLSGAKKQLETVIEECEKDLSDNSLSGLNLEALEYFLKLIK